MRKVCDSSMPFAGYRLRSRADCCTATCEHNPISSGAWSGAGRIARMRRFAPYAKSSPKLGWMRCPHRKASRLQPPNTSNETLLILTCRTVDFDGRRAVPVACALLQVDSNQGAIRGRTVGQSGRAAKTSDSCCERRVESGRGDGFASGQ